MGRHCSPYFIIYKYFRYAIRDIFAITGGITIPQPCYIEDLKRSRTLQVLLSVIWKLFGDKALPFRFHGQIHRTRQADNHLLHNNFFQTSRQTKRFPFPMFFH